MDYDEDINAKRQWGLPSYEDWTKLKRFEEEKKGFDGPIVNGKRVAGSVMVGRVRTLEEIRYQIAESKASPLQTLYEEPPFSKKRIANTLSFLVYPAMFALNIYTICNNFANRNREKENQNFEAAEEFVAWMEFMIIFALLFGIVTIMAAYACACGLRCTRDKDPNNPDVVGDYIPLYMERPRLLMNFIQFFKSAATFSTLQGIKDVNPANYYKHAKRIWVTDAHICSKVIQIGFISAIGPTAIVVLFAKLAQLGVIYETKIEDWGFTEYALFLGFTNQIIGVTDDTFITQRTIFDFIFSGADCKFQRAEAETQSFVLMMIYSDLVGEWGWHGFVYAMKMGAREFQQVFITEAAPGKDRETKIGGDKASRSEQVSRHEEKQGKDEELGQ